MCGICGIFGGLTEHQNINKMLNAMRHRGPDDTGFYQDDNITMGQTRLAIIDLSSNAHQPMANSKKNIWLVYNGETYNYWSERHDLINKGYQFNSTSDSEVVLKMYELYGDTFLNRMRGMFALAIYDKRNGPGKERLILARDHLGIKPLLYSQTKSNFIFGSELKAILASELVEKRIEPEALRSLMTFGSISQPLTMIAGVKMMLPGHYLTVEAGKVTIHRYWKMDFNRVQHLNSASYADQVDVLRSALEESVRLQQMSDVPIGAFLSGGIDSSLLVAMFAKSSKKKVQTFSVGFQKEGQGIDETDDAERIAKFIGTDHTKVIITGKDARNHIEKIVYGLDQPTIDGANSYFVSMAAKKSVTVAISGTGGDELFAGYPWFFNMALNFWKTQRYPLFYQFIKKIGKLFCYPAFDRFIGRKFVGPYIDRARARAEFVNKYARQYQIFGAYGASAIVAEHWKDKINFGQELSEGDAFHEEIPLGSPLARVSALCLRGYTQNQLLRDIDSASMIHSLEVRVPFLDHKLVDIALSLPDHTKLGNIDRIGKIPNGNYRKTGAKKILIDAGRELLPQGIDLQNKRGFGMPFGEWLLDSMRDIFEETLSDKSISNRGLFNPPAVQSYKAQFFNDRKKWSFPWLLMVTELWCRQVLDNAN